MTFYWPHAFWLLVIPLGLFLFELRRRRRAASTAHPKILRAEAGLDHLAFTSANAPAVTTSPARWRLALGLALAITAVARPQWGRIEEPVFDQSREILIAIDLSRSMLSPDVKPNRLDRSKLLITSLLERLKGERVGLVVFAGTAFLQVPLSADYEILREFLPTLDPAYLPQGGTNYKGLLDAAIDAFGTSASADRFLVILSDGEATDDDWKPAANTLKTKGIRVLGLGVGTDAGAMIPDGTGGFVKDERGAVVMSRLNSSTLQELATITDGTYLDASSWVDLAALVNDTVERGKRGDFKETSRVRLAERFQWALAPAILLLVWSFWREFPVRPRNRDLLNRPTGATPPPVPPAMPAPRPSASTVVGALAVLLAFTVPPPGRAQTPATPPPAKGAFNAGNTSISPNAPRPTAPSAADAQKLYAQPLIQAATELAQRERAPSATDFKHLAEATLSYGQRMAGAKQTPAEKTIGDGIEAVDAGAALDPKAADWPKLRKDLEALLPKPEDQQQDQPDQKDKQDNKDQNGEGGDKQKSDQKSDDQKDKQDQQNQEQQQQQDPSKQEQNQQDDKPAEAADQQQQQKAFGDMNEQPPNQPKDAQPEPQDMQQVGGSEEKQPEAGKETDPQLAIPLQKLDQLRNQDSPAKLYQILQGQPKATPAQKGKDW